MHHAPKHAHLVLPSPHPPAPRLAPTACYACVTPPSIIECLVCPASTTRSPECRQEELQLAVLQARDIRLQPALAAACTEEQAAFCQAVELGEARRCARHAPPPACLLAGGKARRWHGLRVPGRQRALLALAQPSTPVHPRRQGSHVPLPD